MPKSPLGFFATNKQDLFPDNLELFVEPKSRQINSPKEIEMHDSTQHPHMIYGSNEHYIFNLSNFFVSLTFEKVGTVNCVFNT